MWADINHWVSYSFPKFILLGASIGFIVGWLAAFFLGLAAKLIH